MPQSVAPHLVQRLPVLHRARGTTLIAISCGILLTACLLHSLVAENSMIARSVGHYQSWLLTNNTDSSHQSKKKDSSSSSTSSKKTLITICVFAEGSISADNPTTIKAIFNQLAWVDRPVRVTGCKIGEPFPTPSLLFNVRSQIGKVTKQVQAMNVKDNTTKIALHHMADELNTFEHWPYYTSTFEFIIRDYKHPSYPGASKNLTSPVLGSLTCESKDKAKHQRKKNNIRLFYSPQMDFTAWHDSNHDAVMASIPILARRHKCWWQGSIRNRRQAMVDFFQHSNASDFCTIEVADKFGGNPDTRGAYIRKMTDTIFCLNPAGNQPENIRWGEIMAAGAISVMIDKCTYCDAVSLFSLNGNEWPPGIYARDWQDAEDQMKRLWFNETSKLVEMHHKTIDFAQRMYTCVLSDYKLLFDRMLED